MRAGLTLAALAATALLALAPAARADGDPASDYLLSVDVFYPYYSNKPKQELAQLQETVKQAALRKFKIKVAIITTPFDLGTLGLFWHQPQRYCSFLSQEIAFVYKGRLLVVTPNGYGYVEHMRAVPAKLALVRTIPIGKGSSGLLKSGDEAVRALARSAGHTLPAPSGSAGSDSSTRDIVLILVAAIGVIGLSGGAHLVLRRRRRPAGEAGRANSS